MENADKDRLLDAALNHVIFDGWSDETFNAAVEDTGIEPAVAKIIFPRAGLDMAVAFHKRGDAQMKARLKAETLSAMRFRDRVAAAVKYRIEAISTHKEAVRRGSALFSLPQNAALGAKLIWETSDAIWTALGDASQDYNWYTKRATLSWPLKCLRGRLGCCRKFVLRWGRGCLTCPALSVRVVLGNDDARR